MGLIPRDEKFFGLFEELAKRCTSSAELVHRLFSEPQSLAQHVAAIKELEHQADHVTHDVIDRIDRSFVTHFGLVGNAAQKASWKFALKLPSVSPSPRGRQRS